ncbi:serine/threonine-protein kinase [Rubrivivax albus]|uniref:Serine/threonine protein kinase n=1 Tax=Rubrivivax albus TaxID=2499835 RepID=A0A3S2TM54_9BURK|nr:serine/threonine-protein kinase [Rubrivivax albus]RVT50909.1 serine/threonine protein kinase [Rubrivivax albus]
MDIPAALWPEVSAAFDAALDWPTDEREARLAALESSRRDLADALRRLLAAHASTATLASADGALMQHALDDAVQPLEPGRVVGIYRLQAPLGRGGMSSVWAADQLEGVHRRVALKLPHPGLEPAEALAARFARERDLLAALEHPHIARLYDAGVDGIQPWLAMALVDGTSLTDHAARLPLRQRVELFLQVLDAVQFAHARLIVHRDLKPANILVDRAGQVQLLDFGVAQLLGDHGPGAGVLALTPDCASPELLAGEPAGVACDVYALGVVLYELLSGQRPYRLDPRSPQPLREQLALQLTPPGLSRPSAHGAAVLAGDLDAIVLKAMASQTGARFASVEALAADLQAWLDRRPVQARGGGRWYRTGLAMRRHAGAVTGGLATVLALAIGLGSALWQAREAQAHAQRVEATQRWLIELFEAASPERSGEHPPDARQLILQGSARLEAGLSDQPALRADLQRLAGELLLKLQDWHPAAAQLQAAADGDERAGRQHRPEALQTLESLAEALDGDARHDEALQVYDRLQAVAERHLGVRNAWRRPAGVGRAMVLLNQGDAAAAGSALEATLALPPGTGEDAAHTNLLGLYGQALVAWHQGRIGESARQFAQVVEASLDVPAFARSNVLMARYRLLTAWGREGDFARVLAGTEGLLADCEALLGPRATLTIHVLEARVQALARQGRYAEAVALQRETVSRVEQRSSHDDEQRVLSGGMLGQMLVLAGAHDEGVSRVRATVAFLDRKYPQASVFTEVWRLMQGMALVRAQRWDEAVAVLNTVLSRSEGVPAMDPTVPAEARQLLALAAVAQGRPGDAGTLFAQACPALAAVYGADGPRVWRCQAHQAWATSRRAPTTTADAESALAAFDAVATRYRQSLPPEHVVGAELDLMRADLLARVDPAAAAPLRALGQAAWQRVMGAAVPAHFSGLH